MQLWGCLMSTTEQTSR